MAGESRVLSGWPEISDWESDSDGDGGGELDEDAYEYSEDEAGDEA